MPANQIAPQAAEQDDDQPLYKRRVKIHPKDVDGPFRRFKWAMLIVTLAIYYVTPWIRWDRGEGAPDQAVLLDLANARFYFFFVEIWPQEFYYVAGLLIMAGLGLFLVTSVVGRAWCGYACPQTVWTDLFLWIERRIEGDRNAQMRLDNAPWTTSKIAKRVLKHASFILVGLMTGGAWVFYFADAPTLAMQLVSGQAILEAYVAVGVLTFTTYALGGLMREQVCIYMCPWPRIQGAMLDERSLIVTYNDWRGEPRGRHRKAVEDGGPPLGDCVDCDACVAVCPMGIDIRDGQQLECITCALCIDACDAVMAKIGKPKGLISYTTLETYSACSSGACQTAGGSSLGGGDKPMGLKSLFKLRSVIYFGLWAAIGVALLAALATRDRLDATIHHDRNPQYVVLSDGSVRNAYQVKILNMWPEPRLFQITLEGLPGATLRQVGAASGASQPTTGSLMVAAPADDVLEMRLFIQRPKHQISEERLDFDFRIDALGGLGGLEEGRFGATFHAPKQYANGK